MAETRPYDTQARQLIEEVIGIGIDEYRLARVNGFLESFAAQPLTTTNDEPVSDKLTFKQVKFLLDHITPEEGDDGLEAEIVTEINLKTHLALYKNTEGSEATPGEPISVNIHYYNDEMDPEEFDPASYYACLLNGADNGNLSYDEIQELFQLDPNLPIWEVEIGNSSFDETTIADILAKMDE